MGYKLVAIDLDGTLLNKEDEVSQYNIEVIKKLKKLGIKIAIITGRRFISMMDVVKDLEIELPYICFNGGMVVNQYNHEIIYKETLDMSISKQVLLEMKEKDIPIFIYKAEVKGPSTFYYNSGDHPRVKGYIEFETKRNQIAPIKELDKEFDFDPICIKSFGHYDDIKKVEYLKEKYQHSDLTWLQTVGVNKKTHYLELYPSRANKANGLKWLSEQYNIKKSDIIAIGDNLNDLEMLEWAGLGIAMGNAHQKAKEAADLIAPNADDDGVGKILEEVFNIY
jgi:Cof subfamily protein (haloacid dehalogenase superfamily)